MTSLFLPFTDFDKRFIVETDMSMVGDGSVIAWSGDYKKTHPIHSNSGTITKEERSYDACDRETFAVLFGLRHFCLYLLSTEPCILISDHKSLKNALKKIDMHGMMAR